MKVKDISEVNVEVKLRETFTVTTIMTEKKNVENQAVSVSTIALEVQCLRITCTFGHFTISDFKMYPFIFIIYLSFLTVYFILIAIFYTYLYIDI